LAFWREGQQLKGIGDERVRSGELHENGDRTQSTLGHVVARDPTVDEVFWSSVVTSGIPGIDSRPSCLSWTVNLKTVRFHDSSADVEAVGFQPSKRCKPDQPSSDVRDTETVAHMCRLA
jgi:methylphosphotriester-DNA--protein-cysteine methyltransferase